MQEDGSCVGGHEIERNTTMIAGPLLMDVVPTFAPPGKIASFYGFNGYSLAIGGGLSTIVGGWFYDLGALWGWPGFPWTVCLAVGLIAAWRLYRLKDSRNRFHLGAALKQ
jgi:DHA1 family multidrug resistance protein-like MFS transporter